ncbi:type II toxin-antitoxin system RelE/ParE family toxin [Chenggangzhangella methanolivorans]|uniref:Type II toxin-antitoxin system RelE/ParE family toxin n=1 Tax=Chenggangzhangella methanolivorans TaxID=1437009 RepID=A0A9E6RDX3_9HYPH|nr:type II toxin-antitoxin system RelE/ParE family toxin [Chenggangzhangella methanolivorans]QZN99345.1 type II toxin-antitoxin system RelE/ParE family toxin [Chenggangzhangella methanolivorans]
MLKVAELDLDRLEVFLAQEDPRASVEALRRIRAAANDLLAFPALAPTIHGRASRRLTVPFGRGAYRVDRERETVVILRVRHSREAR